MGAHPMDGDSYYQSEAAALGPEDGSFSAKQKLAKNGLRIRFKFPKTGELNKEASHEVLPSDLRLEGASDGDMRAHHVSNGEFADDRDKHIESPSHHRGDDDGLLVKVEENVADKVVAEDYGSSKSKNEDTYMFAEKPPTCIECGKAFPSLKALYGHLRCHPQRGYRGANRPPEAKNKHQIGIDSSSSDRVLPAAKWSVTAKRGRKGIIDSNNPEANAASILLQLSRGNNLRPTPTLPRDIDRLRARDRKSILVNIRIEMDKEATEAEGPRLMDAMYSEYMDGNEDEYTDEMKADNDGNVEASSRLLVFQRKVKKKKKKMKDLESVNEAIPPTRGRYRCSTCNKSFSTHQALGGHRASHNKNKNNSEVVVAMDEIEDGDRVHAEVLVDSSGVVPRAATAEHRCTLCQATFPTGQALGGHKRRHWNGPVNHPPLSPPAASTPAPSPPPESVKKANHGLLDIDLNELPKLEAEEP